MESCKEEEEDGVAVQKSETCPCKELLLYYNKRIKPLRTYSIGLKNRYSQTRKRAKPHFNLHL
jgi:hypothetical protein